MDLYPPVAFANEVGGQTPARDMQKKGKRFLFLLLVIGFPLGTLIVFREPILTGIANFLVVSDPLQKADAIAVLSGGGAVRSRAAAELYLRGLAPRILVTKERLRGQAEESALYGIHLPDELEIVRAVFNYMKIPADCVGVLDESTDSTLADARVYLAYMKNQGWKRLIVVTSNFHTRRSRMIVRRIFRGSNIDVSISAAPPNWEFDPEKWWFRRENIKTLIFEYQKLFFYALRYW